jgi:hypothetical protein
MSNVFHLLFAPTNALTQAQTHTNTRTHTHSHTQIHTHTHTRADPCIRGFNIRRLPWHENLKIKEINGS